MLLVERPWRRKVGNDFGRGARAPLLRIFVDLGVLEAEANNLENWISFD